MTFICPDCKFNTLQIQQSLELPSDAYNDEITLQIVACNSCGLRALAVYRESRRGALDAETWHHDGYRVSGEDFAAVRDLIKRCPAPADSSCQCFAHQRLGQMNGYSWDGLQKSGVKIHGVFEMQFGAAYDANGLPEE